LQCENGACAQRALLDSVSPINLFVYKQICAKLRGRTAVIRRQRGLKADHEGSGRRKKSD
jgi:hypothetical protein